MKHIYYLKEQESISGKVVHEIKTDNKPVDDYDLITWTYRYGSIMYSQALKELVGYYMWPN